MTDINPTELYVVHAGIPIPEVVREQRDDADRWPFSLMETGDCFDEPNTGDFDRVRTRASMHGFRTGRKYSTRVMQRDGQMNCPVCQTCYPVPPQFVLRVWRVE